MFEEDEEDTAIVSRGWYGKSCQINVVMEEKERRKKKERK